MNLFGSHYFSAVHQYLIVVHVLSALFSLLFAPIAMYVQKGGLAHRRWGKAYFWGMVVANLTAFVLLFYRFNIFLLGVTVLSLYGAVTGYRVLYRKKAKADSGATWFDWSLAVATLIMAAALFAWGVTALLGGTPIGIPAGGSVPLVFIILPLVFGLIIGANAITDLRAFRNPPTSKLWWWYYHMDRMLGSYIGLTTALMVQQVGPRMPAEIAWIVWIAPAIVGSVLISRWIASYRKQFNDPKQPKTA